jgi:hypothetical protein
MQGKTRDSFRVTARVGGHYETTNVSIKTAVLTHMSFVWCKEKIMAAVSVIPALGGLQTELLTCPLAQQHGAQGQHHHPRPWCLR